jgi:hypothetical protein
MVTYLQSSALSIRAPIDLPSVMISRGHRGHRTVGPFSHIATCVTLAIDSEAISLLKSLPLVPIPPMPPMLLRAVVGIIQGVGCYAPCPDAFLPGQDKPSDAGAIELLQVGTQVLPPRGLAGQRSASHRSGAHEGSPADWHGIATTS